MKTVEAHRAVKFTCAYCENNQCVEEDTLKAEEIDGTIVLTAIVDCSGCSHENKLVMPLKPTSDCEDNENE